MSKRRNSKQMLLDLARSEGPGVVHLPYSREFEAVCQKIKPAATTDDKHHIWEELLDLGGKDGSPRDPGAVPHVVALPAERSEVPEPSTSHTHGRGNDGLLFPIHDHIDDFQPWSVPREPDLTPERAAHRQKMLADIA